MPSPFPGMDPYLESPDIWPDFHDAFATEIRNVLNLSLPDPYYARLDMWTEVGIADEGKGYRRIIPDVSVVRGPVEKPQSGGVAVLDAPRTTISHWVELEVACEPIRHLFVEIRDPSRGHELVTLIEIVSPTNKVPGMSHQKYLRKQREVLASTASLIEIDLLRTGERPQEHVDLLQFLDRMEPRPDYLVLVNYAWKRIEDAMAYRIFPVILTQTLPCIPVPLREGQNDLPLDLQYVFNRAYGSGPYRRGAVDYTKPPRPALPEDLSAWVADCLRSAPS